MPTDAWKKPEDVLLQVGLRLEYEDVGSDITVGVMRGAEDVGEVNLSLDPDRNVYQITYSELFGLPKGQGLGTSVYRAIRDYVHRQHHGSTVASDYRRSPDANRAWQGMVKAGLARLKTTSVPGVPNRGGEGDLTYYVMDGVGPVRAGDDVESGELPDGTLGELKEYFPDVDR